MLREVSDTISLRTGFCSPSLLHLWDAPSCRSWNSTHTLEMRFCWDCRREAPLTHKLTCSWTDRSHIFGTCRLKHAGKIEETKFTDPVSTAAAEGMRGFIPPTRQDALRVVHELSDGAARRKVSHELLLQILPKYKEHLHQGDFR